MNDWPITNVSQLVTRTTGETTTTSFPPVGDYQTDFSEYTTSGGLPGDWTKCWRTTDDTIDIVTSGPIGAMLGGKALESSVTSGWRKTVKWDDLDDLVNVDVYARVQCESGTNRAIELTVRGDDCGNGSGPYTGYTLTMFDDTDVRIYAYDNEGFGNSIGGTQNVGNFVDKWMWIRFQVTGKGTVTVRAKVWQDGSPEPGSWLFDVTTSTEGPRHSGGFIAFGSNDSTGPARWLDYLSVDLLSAPSTTTIPPTTTSTSTTLPPFGEWVDYTDPTWWTANKGSWNALNQRWDPNVSFQIRLVATAALRGPGFRPLKMRITKTGTTGPLTMENVIDDFNIINACGFPNYTSLEVCDMAYGGPGTNDDIGAFNLDGIDASYTITKIEFFVQGLTTTTAPPPGTWETRFGNQPHWTCFSNCLWNAGMNRYQVAGPGLTMIPFPSGWEVGYRPTKIRITARHNLGVPWNLTLNSGLATIPIPVGAGPFTVEAPITWGGDITGISEAQAPGVGYIENIEFFVPLVTTTTAPPGPLARKFKGRLRGFAPYFATDNTTLSLFLPIEGQQTLAQGTFPIGAWGEVSGTYVSPNSYLPGDLVGMTARVHISSGFPVDTWISEMEIEIYDIADTLLDVITCISVISQTPLAKWAPIGNPSLCNAINNGVDTPNDLHYDEYQGPGNSGINLLMGSPSWLVGVTTTTAPPEKFLVPDGDLSPSEWGKTGAVCLAKTYKFECIDSGISFPNDTEILAGLDATQRFSVVDPVYLGVSHRMRAWVRVRHADGDPISVKFYDGAVLLGTEWIYPSTSVFKWYITPWLLASKTAAELQDLEIELYSGASSNDHYVTEVVVEIQQSFETTTTSTSTSTTPPENLLTREDEFDDTVIEDFWIQQDGLGGGSFVEAGGKMSFDSGIGIFPLPTSLWHYPVPGDEADVTWLHQEPREHPTRPGQIDFKVPFIRPPGFGAEGDTIGVVVWENDQRFAMIYKTIRQGREMIRATHVRQKTDLTVVVRHREIEHRGWPFYLRIKTYRNVDTGLGEWHLQTYYGEKPNKFIELRPRFWEYDPERYQTAIGQAENQFKVGIFAHHGAVFPLTSTTVTDPPGPGGRWFDRSTPEWMEPPPTGTVKFAWDSENDAWTIVPDDAQEDLYVGDSTHPDWWVGFRPTHARISFDCHEQEIDAFVQVISSGGTIGQQIGPVRKTPAMFKLNFTGEDIQAVRFIHNSIPRQKFIAIRKIEFWKYSTTTTTGTTTSTGPLEPGPLDCRNQWNPSDIDTNMSLSLNNYRMTAITTNGVRCGRGVGHTSGKLYFEIEITNFTLNEIELGICKSVHPLSGTRLGRNSHSWGYDISDGSKWHNNIQTAGFGPTLDDGDIFNVAVDMDNAKVWFGKNNSWFNNGKPHLGLAATYEDPDIDSSIMYPVAMIFQQNDHVELWSQEDLVYQPPAGFVPWCSAYANTTTTIPPTTTTAAPTTTLPPTTTTSITFPALPFDEFNDSVIGLQWIKDTDTGGSMIENFGRFRPTSGSGDVSGTQFDPCGIWLTVALNLDLYVKLTVPTLTAHLQQAGFMLRIDDNNFVKIVRAYDNAASPKNTVYCSHVIAGVEWQSFKSALNPQPNTVWFRLHRVGSTITALWKWHPNAPWTALNPASQLTSTANADIWLFANHPGASSFTAEFDYFRDTITNDVTTTT